MYVFIDFIHLIREKNIEICCFAMQNTFLVLSIRKRRKTEAFQRKFQGFARTNGFFDKK